VSWGSREFEGKYGIWGVQGEIRGLASSGLSVCSVIEREGCFGGASEGWVEGVLYEYAEAD
jgi:hypothetical protein